MKECRVSDGIDDFFTLHTGINFGIPWKKTVSQNIGNDRYSDTYTLYRYER